MCCWWKDSVVKVMLRGFLNKCIVCYVTWCRWKNVVVRPLLWTPPMQDRGTVEDPQNGTWRWIFGNIFSSVPVHATTWAMGTSWTTRYKTATDFWELIIVKSAQKCFVLCCVRACWRPFLKQSFILENRRVWPPYKWRPTWGPHMHMTLQHSGEKIFVLINNLRDGIL
jgi:hypothetical protein